MSARIVTHRSRGNYNPNYNKQDYIISNRDNIITNSDTKDTLLSLSGCLFRGGQVAHLSGARLAAGASLHNPRLLSGSKCPEVKRLSDGMPCLLH